MNNIYVIWLRNEEIEKMQFEYSLESYIIIERSTKKGLLLYMELLNKSIWLI